MKKRKTSLKDFIRYKSPLLFVHVLLIVLGLLNLYPFVWMLGTSMKAEAEASSDRMSPIPRPKFMLVDEFDLHEAVPLPLAPGLREAEGFTYERLLGNLRSKLRLIDRLQRRADEEGAYTHPIAYSGLARVDVDEAQVQLNHLVDVGLLVRDGERDTPEGPLPRYRLAPGAEGIVHRDMLPRQVLTLINLHEENRRRATTRSAYAADRISATEYNSHFGLSDMEKAEVELKQMMEAGWVTDGTWQVMNYWVVLKGENHILNFLTTVLLTCVVVLGTIFTSSMLGYALARMRFPGRFWILGVMIFSSILPSEARMIPIFKMLLALNGLENLWGLSTWLISFGVGNALLMAGFFLTLPKEVGEAAEVDGAGVFRTFFDIMLPMAQPIVMTVGMFAFLTAWNEFLVPLLCTISRPSMQPLAVAVYNFQAGHPGKWHQINAAASIMVLPVILGFLCVQKHVVKSIAVGAVKG
ncbi:MAG: carbohydrate ABC transporter permease [Verrucomicrobia bacterium]|nr:carbohydrate ABC transporter permease [Verrucomicrobiota bacterium]MCH8513251.1 carbohydrate ABC transporter permease [Kiritimatiellia bacterium]